MRIVCISDTHGLHAQISVPDGDVLVHAGDLCNAGTFAELYDFAHWVNTLPHKHKIVIAGNHDWCFRREPKLAREILEPFATYLQDEAVIIDGVKFYGSPWQPEFGGWAFNLPRFEPIAEKWRAIPDDTDVLITHGPAWGYLDECRDGRRVGCEELAKRVKLVKPKLHIFGHIHNSHGKILGLVNAAICNDNYEPKNKPIVVEIDSAGEK